jgi:hypothetical protein
VENERYIKICLKCASTKVKEVVTPFMVKEDICQKCGNAGNFPEVKIEEVERFRKKLINQKSQPP